MSTVFPFNQIPKIPLTAISSLLPTFLSQKRQLIKLMDELQQRVDALKKSSKCNDADVLAIKSDLQKMQSILLNIDRIFNALQPISSRLNGVSVFANTLSVIQLAIPAVPGVPIAPVNQAVTSFAELIQNVSSATSILNNVISDISSISNRAESVITSTQNKLDSLCPTDFNSAGIDAYDNINNLYPSEFYQEVNVSNDDIDDRINKIQQLIDEQIDVLQNLNEAPSKVLFGTGTPNSDLGKLGDYYIDSNTQQVYGPKRSINSWT
jgi:hypothetical protein